MPDFRRLLARLLSSLRRPELDTELAEELHAHRELLIEENLRRGMSADDASRQAALALGNTTGIRESYREEAGLPLLETCFQDIRYGLRLLAKDRGFTIVCILTLALGIGANTAIYSMIYQVMLRPLPFSQSEQLVRVVTRFPKSGFGANVVPVVADSVVSRTRSLDSVAVGFPSTGCNLAGAGSPEYVRDRKVSANFFQTLGVRPLLGRLFLAEDAAPGSQTALVSYGLWQRQFGGDRNVLGRQIECNGSPLTVVGVLPRELSLQFTGEVWTSGRLAEHLSENGMNYTIVGRLKSGVSRVQAQQDLDRLFAQLRSEYSGKWWASSRMPSPGIMEYREMEVGDLRRPLMLLLGAVALVLLIACANVAGLLLARTMTRAHEIAIRAAIGAARMRIARQMLTESVVLNLLGGAAGMALGWGVMRAMKQLIPGNTSFFGFTQMDVNSLELNWAVLLFTFAVALVAGVICGIAPSLAASCADPGIGLGLGSRGGGLSRGRLLTRKFLLSAQVAVSLVLLVGAALMVRSVMRLHEVNLGFEPRNLAVAQLSLGSQKFQSPEAVWRFEQSVIDKIAARPGVVGAAAVSSPPLAGGLNLPAPMVDGKPCPAGGALDFRAVTPRYFDVMRIPLLRGRSFSADDVAGRGGVVVVNQAMARACWPDRDPIGQQLWFGKDEDALRDIPRQVVGVVGDVREFALDSPAPPMVFVPQAQVTSNINELLYRSYGLLSAVVIRTARPLDISVDFRRAVEETDPQQPVVRVSPMSQTVSESITSTRLLMVLLAAFASLAVLLTATGIYGLLAYHVAQRRREIGIRLALGARRREIQRMVLGEVLTFVAGGITLGLAGALAATKLLTSLTFGIGRNDPVSFVATIVLLVAVSMLAGLIPARRATRVDPLVALRCD